jgi:hypothetical protein
VVSQQQLYGILGSVYEERGGYGRTRWWSSGRTAQLEAHQQQNEHGSIVDSEKDSLFPPITQNMR